MSLNSRVPRTLRRPRGSSSEELDEEDEFEPEDEEDDEEEPELPEEDDPRREVPEAEPAKENARRRLSRRMRRRVRFFFLLLCFDLRFPAVLAPASRSTRALPLTVDVLDLLLDLLRCHGRLPASESESELELELLPDDAELKTPRPLPTASNAPTTKLTTLARLLLLLELLVLAESLVLMDRSETASSSSCRPDVSNLNVLRWGASGGGSGPLYRSSVESSSFGGVGTRAARGEVNVVAAAGAEEELARFRRRRGVENCSANKGSP